MATWAYVATYPCVPSRTGPTELGRSGSSHRPRRAAASAGFDYTGFRLTPTASGIDHGIVGNGVAIRELKSAIDGSGVGILDLEVNARSVD